MNSYTILVTSQHTIEVEADSEQNAIEQACGKAWEYDADSINGVVLNNTQPNMKPDMRIYNLSIRLPADVAEYDGECTILPFQYDANQTKNPLAAIKSAVQDFLLSPESLSARNYAGDDFNWGDMITNMPNQFFEKHGMYSLSISSMDQYVDHDELLSQSLPAVLHSIWKQGNLILDATCTVETATHHIDNITFISPNHHQILSPDITDFQQASVMINGTSYTVVPIDKQDDYQDENVFFIDLEDWAL